MKRLRQRTVCQRVGTFAVLVALVPLLLAACGNGGRGGKQIVWTEGTPANNDLTFLGTVDQSATATAKSTVMSSVAATLKPTGMPASRSLSVAERVQFQPNEAGGIPILMYHVISPDPVDTEDGYARSADDFAGDLERLYDQDYFVVPLHDVIQDRLTVPAGKHPVVLTFDDATAGQFRYLIESDGAVSIDPRSAVGIMESFYAIHPDFGRGGYFAVPAATCFDWEATGAEPEQTPFCGQKLSWLVDHDYEVGNHTVNHADLLDVDDATFETEVGGDWIDLQALAPQVQPDILALPYGNYPDRDKHPQQRVMLRDGFAYRGMTISLIGALMVGANPAPSPASRDWDPLYIPRIRAYDGEYGSSEWMDVLAADQTQLYTSDGDPTTVSVPVALVDGLDQARLIDSDIRVIAYDPDTGITR